MNSVTRSDIEAITGFELHPFLKNRLATCNLDYFDLTEKEYNDYLINVISVLTGDITQSGEHRITEWERGWEENLKAFLNTRDTFDLVPKYHSKRKYVRWMKQIINPVNKNFDYNIHTIFVDSIVSHYLKDCLTIFEFGCGPGYHLVRLNDLMPDKKYWGSDWTKSSQHIIEEINSNIGTNISTVNFNFFLPNREFVFPENCGIFTVAALEQVGDKFKDFVDYILEKKPSICLHLEPIDELLNKDELLDFLSIRYFRKRNYLYGFLPYLEQLERLGKIEIIKKQRIFTGSYFIEGHSLVVWKVK